jgi:hypothetical protein
MAERRRRGFWTLALWIIGGVGVLLLVLFAVLVGPWLFTKNTEPLNPDQRLKAENDVRTTLVQALGGLAVASGLIVTYRTYRQNQSDQAFGHRQQDRTYGRELYAQAVEQLGHAQAPVRLGALYSLESLAQDQPQRRQTVVDVLCAYLRMAYTPPDDDAAAADHGDVGQLTAPSQLAYDPAQELQVRQTAQRLLGVHLVCPPDISGEEAQRRPPSPDDTFWPGINLDLTGAALVEFVVTGGPSMESRLKKASVRGANFTNATFVGQAWFYGTTFTGEARFDGATFTEEANFGQATFTGEASFIATIFNDRADFSLATFGGRANFLATNFHGEATFTGVRVLHLDDSDLRIPGLDNVWPDGLTVRPNPTDPTRGTLVREDPGPNESSPAED